MDRLMMKEIPTSYQSEAYADLNNQLKGLTEDLHSTKESKEQITQRCHELDMQNDELQRLAEESQAMKDELDFLRHTSDKVKDCNETKVETEQKKKQTNGLDQIRTFKIHPLDAKINALLQTIVTDSDHDELNLPANLKGACVNKASLATLKWGRWLNDNIIDSYCVYLTNIKFKEKTNLKIFSSFFMFTILECVKNEKTIKLDKIMRYRKVNIFTLDFMIVPICEKHHWTAAVITHPGSLLYTLGLQQNESGLQDKCIFKPRILYFDSLGGIGKEFMDYLRKYIELQIQKQFNCILNVTENELPGTCIRSPTQPNGFDCGIYTLHNIEIFVEKIPWEPFGVPQDITELYLEFPIEGKRFKIFKTLFNLSQSVEGDF